MFRNSLAANSTDLFLTLTPTTTQGAKLEGRSTDGATATIDNTLVGPIPPYWLRMTRVGNLFTAYTSSDGVNWALLGSITVTMGATIDVGLAVSAHNTAALNTSTFQNVSIVPLPYVVNAANASPSPVTGVSANLSALGNENGSSSGLIYTWAATSKPSGSNPIFSVNGTSAAQNTSVTFDTAGVYTFQVTISDTAGASVTSSVNVSVNQTLTNVNVSPPTVNLTSGQSQAFSATALDQFGDPLATQPNFTWTVDAGSVGSINSVGQFTAPLSPVGATTVRATSGAISGTAAVTVSYLKGDVNIDGARTPADVAAMMNALVDLPTFQSSNGLSAGNLTAILDVNGDGAITNADVQSLISLIANGGGGGGGGGGIANETVAVTAAPVVAPAVTPLALTISDAAANSDPTVKLLVSNVQVSTTIDSASQNAAARSLTSFSLPSTIPTSTSAPVESLRFDRSSVEWFFQSQLPAFHRTKEFSSDEMSSAVGDDIFATALDWWNA